MKSRFSSAICATVILLSSAAVGAVLAPANAQADFSVSFNSFHHELSRYGDWVYSDRWGEVWVPQDVPNDFHPYGTNGHWAYTGEYGWYWVSNYDWGDIPFHYGRWVNDPDDGWLWIPGYVWSPGWVIWRSNGQYTGWMPMPPDEEFLNGGPRAGFAISSRDFGISLNFGHENDYYGYSRWYGRDYGQDRFASNWVFVGTGHIDARDYRAYQAPRNNYTTIIHDTKNVTNYTIVNNYVVNRSVDVQVVERAGGHRIQPVRAADVIRRPTFVTQIDTGRQVQMRMRSENPRGTGQLGSAPKPTAQIVQSLSAKPFMHNGQTPTHLFTRDTVTKAPLALTPMRPNPAMGAGSTSNVGLSPGMSPGPTPPTTPNGKPVKETPTERMKAREQNMRRDNNAPGGGQVTPALPKPADKGMSSPAGNNAGVVPLDRRMRDRMSPGNPNTAAPPVAVQPMPGASTALPSNPQQTRGEEMRRRNEPVNANPAPPTGTDSSGGMNAPDANGPQMRGRRGSDSNGMTAPGSSPFSTPATSPAGAANGSVHTDTMPSETRRDRMIHTPPQASPPPLDNGMTGPRPAANAPATTHGDRVPAAVATPNKPADEKPGKHKKPDQTDQTDTPH